MLEIVSQNGNVYYYDSITNKIYRRTTDKPPLFKSRDSFKLLTSEEQKTTIPRESNSLLIIEITEKCNFRCTYCAYSGKYFYERKHSNKSISFPDIEKALSVFFSHTVLSKTKGITFYGGEPLLEKDIILKTINYVKSKFGGEIFFNISTNGLLLDIDFFKEIQGLCGDYFSFSVSIDGPKDIHDRYRKTINNQGTLSRILKKLEEIKSLIDDKFPKHFKFICTIHPPFDLKSINDFFENPLFKDCFLKVITVNWYDTILTSELDIDFHIPSFRKQYKCLTEEYIDDIISNKKPSLFKKALFEKGIMKIHNRIMSPPLATKHAGACELGERIFCSSEKILYPCEKSGGRFFRIGDINEGILLDKIREIEKTWVDLIKDDCRQCFASRMCSLCYVHAIKEHEFNIDRMRMNCEAERKDLKHFLYMYVSIMEENPASLNF